jgi:hypothetical protein
METKVIVDTLWVLITGMLVFFMNLGFALVESGFARSKNTVNILSKNFIVFAISSLAFWAIGWGLMFGNGNGFIGLEGLYAIGGADNSPATGDAYSGVYSSMSWATVPLLAKFFFQLVLPGPPRRSSPERLQNVSNTSRSLFFLSSLLRSCIPSPVIGSGGAVGWQRWDFGILQDPPSYTLSAAGLLLPA